MFRKNQTDQSSGALPSPGADWSTLEAIRAEWPTKGFDQDADLASWTSGMQLYDASDDARSLHHAADLMCQALRHNLFGPGILAGRDLPSTVHHVLYATVTSATLIDDMHPANARLMRLALTITKLHAWQHVQYGGDGRLEQLLEGFPLIFPMCLDELTRRGDLAQFFTRNPIPVEPLPHAPLPGAGERRDEFLNGEIHERVRRTLDDAEGGDPGASARADALAAQMHGCSREEALALHEKAAQLGDVESMYDAGCVAFELGLRPQAIYWWELASAANYTGAMNNLAVLFREEGDIPAAMSWHARAATAGDVEAYPNLVMLARQLGDEEEEFRWARLGAEAGHWFCQETYAQMLARGADEATLRNLVLPFFRSAAENGASSLSMYLAGLTYLHLREPSNAQAWLRRAADAGDERAPAKLRELGM